MFLLEGTWDLHIRKVQANSSNLLFQCFPCIKDSSMCLYISLLKQKSTSFLKQFGLKISALLLFAHLEETGLLYNVGVSVLFSLCFLTTLGITTHEEEHVDLSPKENTLFFVTTKYNVCGKKERKKSG